MWTASGQPAPFASAVIVFGRLPGRHGTEHKTCATCGRIWWPARADAKTCSPKCRARLSRITAVKCDACTVCGQPVNPAEARITRELIGYVIHAGCIQHKERSP